MTTLAEIENAIALLLKQTGREVVQGQIGEFGVPNRPYISWNMNKIDFFDSVDTEMTPLGQVVKARSTPIDILINFAGGNAFVDASTFCLSLRQSQRTADLYTLCGFAGVTPLQNLTAVELGKFRERVQFTLTLYAEITLSNTAEFIETVGVRVRSKSNQPYDNTFIVPNGECK